MRIDGDAARAARREAQQEPIVYALGGVELEFPAELPWFEVQDINLSIREDGWDAEKHVPAFLETMLGEDQWKRLRADVRPSFSDLLHMYGAVLDAYGVSQGESSSSRGSSAARGESSKPKSKGSTAKKRAVSASAN